MITYEYKCVHLQGRRCLLMQMVGFKRPFATPTFCRKHCTKDENKKQIRLLELVESTDNDIARRQAEIDKAIDKIIKHVTHNQDIPASPTKIQLVKTLGRHAIIVLKHLVKTKRVWVSQEVHDARLKVCKTNKCKKCETRDDGSMWCAGGCGCKLSGDLGKTWFEALNCSVGDWPSD